MNHPVEMSYDVKRNRWVADQDGEAYGLHCGECFELFIGSSKIPCRLELDSEWYVVMQGIRFNLRIRDTYMVII